MELRRALTEQGLRYRIHYLSLPGTPDIVFISAKLAIFCNGDFWHGHWWNLKKTRQFNVRQRYWVNKIEKNIARDKRNHRDLRKMGWSVLRLWEKDILKFPRRSSKFVALQDLRAGRSIRLRPPSLRR
jgi:DNA mismatch endonuclease (patch repair protein)